MTIHTITPPVGHGHDLPTRLRRKTDRTPSRRTIAGVRFQNTGIGWAAQGWRIERTEASPAYWIAGRLDEPDVRYEDRNRERLVRTLIDRGLLIADTKRGR